jgi:hypothetical protein
MNKPSHKLNFSQKKSSSLGSRLQVFGLSNPKQSTTKLKLQKFTL